MCVQSFLSSLRLEIFPRVIFFVLFSITFLNLMWGKRLSNPSLNNDIINILLIYRKEGVDWMIARECKQYLSFVLFSSTCVRVCYTFCFIEEREVQCSSVFM